MFFFDGDAGKLFKRAVSQSVGNTFVYRRPFFARHAGNNGKFWTALNQARNVARFIPGAHAMYENQAFKARCDRFIGENGEKRRNTGTGSKHPEVFAARFQAVRKKHAAHFRVD